MYVFDHITSVPEGWTIAPRDDQPYHVTYRGDDGSVDLRAYEPFEGVALFTVDLARPVFNAFVPTGGKPFTVNWCRAGRCEVDFGHAGTAVVGEGALCVSSSVASTFAYPTGSYEGFELWIDLDILPAATQELLGLFGIDLAKLTQRLCAQENVFTMRPTGEVERAVRRLEAEMRAACPDIAVIRRMLCDLLCELGSLDPEKARVRSLYLMRSQRDLAQAIHDEIEANPGGRFNLDSFARQVGASASSLRDYFARVYGMTPAAFERKAVFRLACDQLAGTDLPVSEIAAACGYSNPSKFSAAFRRVVGVNPLEYRRKNRLENLGKVPDVPAGLLAME